MSFRRLISLSMPPAVPWRRASVRRRLAPLSALLVLSLAGAAHGTPGPLVPIHRAGAATLESLVRAQLNAAEAKHKHVVLLFTADWCSPCKALKALIKHDPEVHRAASRGRILTIDVDEWRGPAHRLVPGVNPRMLPTLVRIDHQIHRVIQCYGTDLGLLSPTWTALNLKRLFAGKAPLKPDYETDPKAQRALLIKDVTRQEARRAGQAPVELTVLERIPGPAPQVTYRLRVVLRNLDSRRRWFVLSGTLGEALSEHPDVQGYEWMRFSDHHRATWLRVHGYPAMTIIPVASNSYVALDGLSVEAFSAPTALEVWEVSRIDLDGKRLNFQKKLPYALHIPHAGSAVELSHGGRATLTLRVDKRHQIPIQ